jgi:pimeloyl-ACP methyl ester carboxylesterase
MEQVKVRDLDICCELVGDGYPLVLIMGFTANMDWWDPELVDVLSKRYRVQSSLNTRGRVTVS